jgi:hypothetical protein
MSALPGFLFPVRALAKVFRGRFLASLQRAFDRGELHVPGGLAALAEPAASCHPGALSQWSVVQRNLHEGPVVA